VCERLTLLHVAREGKEDRSQRVVQAAVGHHHVEDRLRLVGHALPHADGLEQPPRGGDDRRRAWIGRRTFECRVRKHDGKGRPERMPQRNCKRKTGQPAAADQHVATLRTLGHATAFRPEYSHCHGRRKQGMTDAPKRRACRPPSSQFSRFSTSSNSK
jgi:hypothetical protein